MSNTVIGASVEIEYKSVGNVRKALKEANMELLAMQDQFGAASKEAINAAKKVAELKDRIEDARETADLFDPGKKFQAFVTLGSQIASGFAAVQGAMALVGVESEEVQKQLLKVQGAMALAKGIGDLKDFGKSWQQVKIFVANATNGMSSFKKALLATGIGLFVVAVGTLIAYWDDLKNAILGTNDITKAYAESQKEVTKAVIDAKTKFKEVTTAMSLAKDGVISKEQALKTYNEKLGDTFGKTNSLEIAEQRMAKYTNTYLKAIELRTRAQVFYGKASEAAAKAAAGEDVEPGFWETLGNSILSAGNSTAFASKQAESYAKNTADLNDQQIKFTAEADKLMKEAIIAEDELAKLTKGNNQEKVKDNKKTNDLIIKQNEDAIRALQKANDDLIKSRLSDREKELFELEKNYKEQFEIIKKGGKSTASLTELYEKQKADVEKKYKEERLKKEEEFQTVIKGLTDRLQQEAAVSEQDAARKAIEDKYAKEREELMKQYPNNLALLILLKQNEKAELDKVDKDFAQKKAEEDAAKLLQQSTNEDLSFQERLAKISEREQMESQLVFKSEDDRLAFLKANSDAKKAIIAAETQFRIDQAQKASDVLGQLSDAVGRETAAGKVMAIAAATINTYLAASKALTGIKTGNPIGAAIAIAQTAAVIATGIKTIREIAKVKVPGGGGGSAPSATAIATAAPMQAGISPAVEGQALNAQAINNLGNQAARAYVLNSDIQNNDQRNAYLERNARIG